MKAAVFLDRDGTLVREVGFVTRPDRLRLLPGAAAALRRLQRKGFPLVMVTNQSAVARGLLSQTELAALHRVLERRLRRHRVTLRGIYVCCHHPRAGHGRFRRRCRCRKPAPGLILRAARDLDLNVRGSYLVGDSFRDVEAARRAGARPILVRTGHGAKEEARVRRQRPRVPVVQDLAAAAQLIMARRA